MRCAGYSLYEQPDDVYDSSMICMQTPAHIVQDGPHCERAMEAIQTGDEAALHALSEDYLKQLFFVPQPPPDYVRGKCTALISGICAVLNTRAGDAGSFVPPRAEEARSIHTVSALQAWLADSLIAYARQYQQAMRQSDPLV